MLPFFKKRWILQMMTIGDASIKTEAEDGDDRNMVTICINDDDVNGVSHQSQNSFRMTQLHTSLTTPTTSSTLSGAGSRVASMVPLTTSTPSATFLPHMVARQLKSPHNLSPMKYKQQIPQQRQTGPSSYIEILPSTLPNKSSTLDIYTEGVSTIQHRYPNPENTESNSSLSVTRSETDNSQKHKMMDTNAELMQAKRPRYAMGNEFNLNAPQTKVNTVLEKKVYISSSQIDGNKGGSHLEHNVENQISQKRIVKDDYTKKYLSSPTCTTCHVKLLTWAEARFHTQSHRFQRCSICNEQIDCNTIEKHVFTCLLLSGTLSNKEMLAYMKNCSVDLFAYTKEAAVAAANAAVAAADDLQNKIQKKRAQQFAMRQRANKNIVTENTIHTAQTSEAMPVSSTDGTQTLNVFSDDANRSRNSNEVDTGQMVNMDEPSNVMQKSLSSKSKRKVVTKFDDLKENNSMPIWWDHEATKEKLFSMNDFPKTKETYIDLDEGSASSMRVNFDASPGVSGACSPTLDPHHEPPTELQISAICDKVLTFKNIFLNGMASGQSDIVKDRENMVATKTTTVAAESTSTNQSSEVNQASSNDSNQTSTEQPVKRRQFPRLKITARRSRIGGRTISDKLHEQNADEDPFASEKRRYSAPLNPLYQRDDSHHDSPTVNTLQATDLSNSSVSVTDTTSEQPNIVQQESKCSPQQPIQCEDSALDLSGTSNNNSAVKILSPNELNLRVASISNHSSTDQPNTNASNKESPDKKSSTTASNQSTSSKGSKSQSGTVVHHRSLGRPIHVSLIKRNGGELELTLTQEKIKLPYDQLNSIQRTEVQKSLLSQNIWFKMLEHIKKGTPTKETLSLFDKLLPENERKIFFDSYNSVKPPAGK